MTKLKFKANLQGLFFLDNNTLLNDGPAVALREAYEKGSYLHYGASYVDFQDQEYGLKSYPKDVSAKIRSYQGEEGDDSLEIKSPGYLKLSYSDLNSEGFTVVNGNLIAKVYVDHKEFMIAEDFNSIISSAIKAENLEVYKAYFIFNLNVPNGLLMSSDKVIRDFRALQYNEFNVEGNSFKLV